MSPTHSSSLARVLAAPWQQRRNTGSLWGLAFVLVACSIFPVVLLAISLLGDPGQAAGLRHKAGLSAWAGIGALLVVGWAMLVGNVLQQNRQTLARLVPGHVAQLRAGLLTAWAVLILAAAAGPGFAFDAPLAWACCAAAALASFAAALRWPILFVAGAIAPIVTAAVQIWDGHAALAAALHAQWHDAAWLIAAIVVSAGAVVLVAMLPETGRGQRNACGAGHAFGGRFANPFASGSPRSPAGRSRPYAWWMARLLARRESRVTSRLLLGLGPTAHWITRAHDSAWFVIVSAGICALVIVLAALLGRDLRGVLPWLSFSLLTGACTPALQATAQLYRTKGEQALLVLLPGVPRGAALNRWLAWQMSAIFIVAALGGLLLAGALDVFAETLEPGLVERSGGDMTAGIAVALLPQVAWQWRRWASLRGGSGKEFLPSFAPFALGGVALLLHTWAGIGYLPIGIALSAASAALCAWRWWRMGSEPSALPMGRLAP